MTGLPAPDVAIWSVADQIAAALKQGVRLDFSDDPERPTFALPPRGRELVASLLDDEATRLRVQAVLRWCVAYRRSLVEADRQEQWRWTDNLGVRLARAVRDALEVSR